MNDHLRPMNDQVKIYFILLKKKAIHWCLDTDWCIYPINNIQNNPYLERN